ncbi:unnamed protein product [Coregonus sp. 'balchen']|nr:unnamed protein product [Coregonus sp. 'balchen']
MNVLHMELDLANMRSMRDFCKTFLQREKRLDILINNAATDLVLTLELTLKLTLYIATDPGADPGADPETDPSSWTYHYSIIFRMLMQAIMFMFFVPCETGAQTVSDEAAKLSGGYFTD